MPNRLPEILLFFIFISGTGDVQAQKEQKEGFRDIFSDLPFDDPAADSRLKKGESTFDKIRNNIIVRPVVSKRRCYKGEPILLRVELWTRLQSTTTVAKLPYLEGFISTPIRIPDKSLGAEKEQGKEFRGAVMLQWQLIPLLAGTLVIDKIIFSHEITFTDSSGKTYSYNGKSETGSVNIIVDSIPAKGRPENYTGMTGDFSLTVFPVNNNIPAGKTNMLRVEIAGTGNYTEATLPVIKWPAEIEVFPVKETAEIITDSFPFAGRKVYEIPFISKREGTIQLLPLSLAFFDPVLKKFKITTSDTTAITVVAAEKKEITPGTAAVEAKPVNGGTGLQRYLLPALAGLLALIILIFWKISTGYKSKIKPQANSRFENEQDVQPEDSETAFNKELADLSAQTDSGEFILSYKKLMTGFLQAKTGTSVVSEEELVKKIQVKDNALAARVWDVYRHCNTLLYSSQNLSAGEREQMSTDLDDIHKAVNKIWE